MRRWIACLAGISLSTSATAQTVQDHIGNSMYWTVRQVLETNGYFPDDQLTVATLSAIAGATANIATVAGQGSAMRNYILLLRALIPAGATIGRPSGMNGGGASGTWNNDYCDWEWRLDAAGNLVIPATPLETGGAMTRSVGSSAYYYVPKTNVNGTENIMADKPESAALWAIHKKNYAYGGSAPFWIGVYKQQDGKSYYSRISSYLANGTKVSYISGYITPVLYTAFTNYGSNQDCPQSGNGGDFHFYHGNTAATLLGNWTQCTMYAPNLSISPNGYFYPDVVAWPQADIPSFPAGADERFRNCKIDPSVIARLINAAWDQADDQPGVIPAIPVSADDVVNGGTEPTVDDLGKPVPDEFPTEGTPTAPSPTPTPTTPSGGSSGGTTNVTVDLGPAGTETFKNDTSLEAPDFGWWPEPPAINIATSAQCPTYAFDAFGTQFTLDTHCQFAEQNRALISALMILVFTIAAARIVLGA